jgi:Ca2+/Na+ antiporter
MLLNVNKFRYKIKEFINPTLIMLNTTNQPCFLIKLLVPSFQEMLIFVSAFFVYVFGSFKERHKSELKGALRLIPRPSCMKTPHC